LSELARVRPTERLRYVGLSHVEADECGALNDGIVIAQQAEPAVWQRCRDGCRSG
jgi:flavorubredoxin